MTEKANDPEVSIEKLHDVWNKEFELRLAAVEKANDLAKHGDQQQPFITVSASYQQGQ